MEKDKSLAMLNLIRQTSSNGEQVAKGKEKIID
jgi:hypothetical protein